MRVTGNKIRKINGRAGCDSGPLAIHATISADQGTSGSKTILATNSANLSLKIIFASKGIFLHD